MNFPKLCLQIQKQSLEEKTLKGRLQRGELLAELRYG